MSRRYGNPPLVEAVVDFAFAAVPEWNEQIIAAISADLAEILDESHTVSGLEGRISVGSRGVVQETSPIERTILGSSNQPISIQMARNHLSVSHTPPYGQWESFLPCVRSAYQAYTHRAKPHGLNLAMVTYVNRITVPGQAIRMEDYFRIYPHLEDPLPDRHADFLISVDIPYDNGEHALRLQFSSLGPIGESATQFLLVLQYIPAVGAAPSDDPFAVIDTAHQRIESVFEGCITDSTRALFEEV